MVLWFKKCKYYSVNHKTYYSATMTDVVLRTASLFIFTWRTLKL